ncbi:MAG: biotin--[acetyl-CoA-carboxylase] ligase, partial [Lentisphaeria bacterium]|nr:biotin--[acetyl-CoA-carboxylase] ligase [Lentisphaeria bacterium]
MHTPNINLLELETVDSTNTYAKNNFDALADGTLVCAEMQTAGRGRLGRSWVSPAGASIYASLVMKQIENPFYATVTASLAAQEVLLKAYPRGGFFIKWPNDIYSGHRKIAGILCEAVSGADGIRGVIAGIGVNINLAPQELDRIDQPAASLLSLSGKIFSVKELTASLAESLTTYYQIYLSEPEKLFAEWKSHNL